MDLANFAHELLGIGQQLVLLYFDFLRFDGLLRLRWKDRISNRRCEDLSVPHLDPIFVRQAHCAARGPRFGLFVLPFFFFFVFFSLFFLIFRLLGFVLTQTARGSGALFHQNLVRFRGLVLVFCEVEAVIRTFVVEKFSVFEIAFDIRIDCFSKTRYVVQVRGVVVQSSQHLLQSPDVPSVPLDARPQQTLLVLFVAGEGPFIRKELQIGVELVRLVVERLDRLSEPILVSYFLGFVAVKVIIAPTKRICREGLGFKVPLEVFKSLHVVFNLSPSLF
mmetsp:Transcript_94248/g.184794  ORF Transcript_94248/g.184794 Transcript_94248/m.184794 type:complete len:277 (-) Transcript_94248:340-1170(-)